MTTIVIRIINQKENPSMQEGWRFPCLIEIGQRRAMDD